MFSPSVPSQNAFPVLFPTSLHSSLPSFRHCGPTAWFDVSLLSMHICLGQGLPDCDAGSRSVREEEATTVYLGRVLWAGTRKSTGVVIKFGFPGAWPALPCENFKRAGNPKSTCCKLCCGGGGGTYLHAVWLLPHGHGQGELLWYRDALLPTSTVPDSLLKWLLRVFFV